MKRSQSKRIGRTGFTLVELLIVIAIIAVLLGLLTGAVAKARSKINEVRNRTDISQLAVSLEAFKSKFKVAYPPSRIVLCELLIHYYADNDPTKPFKSQLHADSFSFLNQMWTRLDWQYPNPPPPLKPVWIGIDWNGDGVPSAPVLLEGDQCLVFFLGGIPVASGLPGCTGFSTNPRNPAAHVIAGGDVISPFYEFAANRLVRRLGTPPPPSPFYSYLDAYGKADDNGIPVSGSELRAYAYFSTNSRMNGYNRYLDPKNPVSDCTTLGVWPYAEAPTPPRYHKPNSFQIVSAGADGVFGSGTKPGGSPWTSGMASTVYPDGGQPGGHDDQSNFYDLLLGVDSN